MKRKYIITIYMCLYIHEHVHACIVSRTHTRTHINKEHLFYYLLTFFYQTSYVDLTFAISVVLPSYLL